MSRDTIREIVVLTRTLRDGSITEERVERWLAELIIGCIPHEEPHVARAKITPLPVDDYRTRSYPVANSGRPQLYHCALALAQAAYAGNPLQRKLACVA